MVFSIGYGELKKLPPIGDFIYCERCKKRHKIKYGKIQRSNDTTETTKMLAFVNCDNGNSYLVGIQGKDIRGRTTKKEKEP